MAAYITVGAKTTHGGTVISGSPHTTHNGIPVARKGDKVACKKCKRVVSIATGDPSVIVDGSPIARAGDVTTCGSKLIANQQAFAESGFDVSGIEQAAALVFPKVEAEDLAMSLAGSNDNNEPPEMGPDGLPILGSDSGQYNSDIYIPGAASTPEEIRLQIELEQIWKKSDGDLDKYWEGVDEIVQRDLLAFDILTMGFPIGKGLGVAAKGASTYLLRNTALKLPSNAKLKVPNRVINKFPESFNPPVPNRKGGEGYRWFDKNSKGNSVRIDKGNLNNTQTRQQVDHVIINSGGKIIGRNGKPIKGSIKDNWDQAHIPLKEYEKWKKWNSPK